MKIQKINLQNPTFGSNRKKFDVQGHIGTMYDGQYNQNRTYNAQNIIDTVESNNVKKVLVSSLSGLNSPNSDIFVSETGCANEILDIKGNDNVKLYPLLSCQPGITQDTTVAENLLKSGKFYGLKFHPTNTNQPIKDNFDIYSRYMDLAEKNEVPCVFHSVTDSKSDPSEIIRLAEKHPKLPVVLYHIDLAANPEQMTKTIDNISDSVKSGKSNLFVDISWLTNLWDNAESNKNIIKQTLEKIGADRILFGSDTPITEMGDKEKYGKFADFIEATVKEFYKDAPEDGEKALNKIFYDNAEEIFIDKKWAKNLQKNASSKKGLLITAGVVGIGILAATINYFMNNNKKEDNNPSRVIK